MNQPGRTWAVRCSPSRRSVQACSQCSAVNTHARTYTVTVIQSITFGHIWSFIRLWDRAICCGFLCVQHHSPVSVWSAIVVTVIRPLLVATGDAITEDLPVIALRSIARSVVVGHDWSHDRLRLVNASRSHLCDWSSQYTIYSHLIQRHQRQSFHSVIHRALLLNHGLTQYCRRLLLFLLLLVLLILL